MGLFTIFNVEVKHINLFCGINLNTNVSFLTMTFRYATYEMMKLKWVLKTFAQMLKENAIFNKNK